MFCTRFYVRENAFYREHCYIFFLEPFFTACFLILPIDCLRTCKFENLLLSNLVKNTKFSYYKFSIFGVIMAKENQDFLHVKL